MTLFVLVGTLYLGRYFVEATLEVAAEAARTRPSLVWVRDEFLASHAV